MINKQLPYLDLRSMQRNSRTKNLYDSNNSFDRDDIVV